MGDYYKIVNRKTGKALNVKDASKEAGVAVIQWDASEVGENSQWSLVKKGELFMIQARHSGLVLDVSQGAKEGKAPLIQYSPKDRDNENQLFELVPLEAKE